MILAKTLTRTSPCCRVSEELLTSITMLGSYWPSRPVHLSVRDLPSGRCATVIACRGQVMPAWERKLAVFIRALDKVWFVLSSVVGGPIVRI